MRCRRLFFVVFGFVFVVSTGLDFLCQTDDATPNVRLSLSSAKETYLRGEIVKLTARIENRSSQRVRVYVGRPGQNQGTLIYISRDGTNYGQYSNPDKENSEGRRSWIDPDARFEKEFEVLWNLKPDITGRSPLGVESVSRGKILTDYVFPTAGTYFVKLVFWDIDDSAGRELPNLESEPIEITVVEPRGDDLEVWRRIERRIDLAYFIQNAWFDTIDTATRERLWREMREIADRYPNSVIARQIGQKLQEFRTKWRKPLPWEVPN